jgi:hypothetical protein
MSARAVKQVFDVLWGELAGIVAKPVVVGGDNVLDLVYSVYDELARSTGGRPCDKGKVIPLYLAHYIFEATLPAKDDLNYEFGLVDEECETDDMDEFTECVNKVCDCVRLAQQFSDTLPQLLTVEVIQDG